MRESLVNFAKGKLIDAFGYLPDFGYQMGEHYLNDDDELVINYKNETTRKDIDFTISDSEDVHRFYIIISIIRNPYLTVNDFISFDAYLQKNNLPSLSSLEGAQIDERSIKKYIDAYAALFYKHGIPLIASNKQFPGYYPEWT